jgi:nitroreductase
VSVIDTILARRSVSPRLVRDPGPSDEELRTILSAGARAADHGKMRPWRFIVVRGEARARLGGVFAACRRQRDSTANDAEIDKERAKPLRAPLASPWRRTSSRATPRCARSTKCTPQPRRRRTFCSPASPSATESCG